MKQEKDIFKKWISVLVILSVFIIAVTSSVLYINNITNKEKVCGCIIPIPYFILILSTLGLFTGSFAFYILSRSFAKEINQECKNQNYDFLDVLLMSLESDERKIMKIILEKQKLRQRDIEKETKLNKVKVHRIVEKLKQKNFIKFEYDKKIKYLLLNNKLKQIADETGNISKK